MTAAAKDLITVARAKNNIQQITDSSQDTRLQTLVTSASDAVEKYCRRDFYSKAYDELYNGDDGQRLLLREYPIQSVASVRYGPQTVLSVRNTLSATNQQARVKVTSTGLTLTRVASGVTTTNTLAFGTYVTLQSLADAIIAIGNGWTATVAGSATGDFGLWPSADLYVAPSFGDGVTSQGALPARDVAADLKLHTQELTNYQFDPRGWLVRATVYFVSQDDANVSIWPRGINNFRVQYTAGYTTIPEAVQEACAEWVAAMYYATLRDPSVTTLGHTGIDNQSWQMDPMKPARYIQRLLAPYRRFTVGTNQG